MSRQPNLFPKLYVRDPSREGASILDTGETGSGKTALMIHTLRRLFEEKQRVARDLREGKVEEGDGWGHEQIAKEKIFWIGDEDCQWSRLPVRVADRLLFVEDGLDLEFYGNGTREDLKSVPFVDFEDIVSYASPLKLNIVYIKDPLRVMDFIQFFIDRSLGEWVSVAVDEVEDIAPSYMEADGFRRAQTFSRRVARAKESAGFNLRHATVGLPARLAHPVDSPIPRPLSGLESAQGVENLQVGRRKRADREGPHSYSFLFPANKVPAVHDDEEDEGQGTQVVDEGSADLR